MSDRQCFFPAGNVADGHTPCNSSLEVSNCCNENEICLSNGLCLQSGLLSRGSCTDEAWGTQCSPYCRENYVGGGSPLQSCGEFRFACDTPTISNDCSRGNFTISEYHIELREPELRSAIEAAGTQTSCSRNEASATNSPLAASATIETTCTQSQSDTLRTNLLGVGLGAVLPLLLALVACIFLLWREKQKQKPPMSVPMPIPPLVPTKEPLYGGRPQEAPSNRPLPHEFYAELGSADRSSEKP